MKRGTPDHPKTAVLMHALGCSKPVAVGTLELLWHFTARFSPRGDIGRFTDAQIAAAVAWDGDPELLVAALVKSRWLDECTKARLVVHDWHEHADDAAKKYVQRNKLHFAVPVRPRSSRVGTRLDKSRHVTPAVAVAVAGAVARARAIASEDDDTRAREGTPKAEPAFVDEARCPDCQVTGTLRRATGDGGWFCGTRLGGCNAQFRLDDPAVMAQLGENARASIEARVARAPAANSPGRRPTAAEQTTAAVQQVAAEEAARRR